MSLDSQFEQIVNDGFLYTNGFPIAQASNSTLTVGAGQARDVGNVFDIFLSAPVTLNGAINGVNGLDTGTLTASSMYAVYVIGDLKNVNPSGVLLSLNFANTPLMPSGYNILRRIGSWSVNGSGNFAIMYQYGAGGSKTYFYDSEPTAVLTSGTATTYTGVSLVGLVPPVAGNLAYINLFYVPATAGNLASVIPFGSSSTTPVAIVSGQVATVGLYTPYLVPTGLNSAAPSIKYKVGNGSDALTIAVTGYVDSI